MKKENCGFDTKIMTLLFHRLLAHRNVKDVVRQAKVHVIAFVRIQFKKYPRARVRIPGGTNHGIKIEGSPGLVVNGGDS